MWPWTAALDNRLRLQTIEQTYQRKPTYFRIDFCVSDEIIVHKSLGPNGAAVAPERVYAVLDWCNLGIMLRIMLGINGVFLLLAGVDATNLVQWFNQALLLALLVEPVLIAGLLCACLVRRYTLTQPAVLQVLLAMSIPAVLTFLLQTALAPVLGFSNFDVWRNAGFAALLTGGLIYWGRLRERAGSRALSEARLQALQARIRPHFFFNSLNAVLGVIRDDPRRAESILEDLAELFRVLMRDSRERVPLAQEIALCRQYLAIEGLRLGERLRVAWDIDESAESALVPGLILQPLIENAVYHGVETRPEGGLIEVFVKREGKMLVLRVVNSVELFPAGVSTVAARGSAVQGARRTGNHMALDNVRERLALIHDLEARLETRIEPGRFEVRVILPRELR